MSIKETELQTAIYLVERRRNLQQIAGLLGKISAGEDWRFPEDAIKFIGDKRALAGIFFELMAAELAKTEHELTKLDVTFEGP